MKVFGIVIWEETRTPREIIKPEVLPGNCWPMKGSSGYVVIKVSFSRFLFMYIFNFHSAFEEVSIPTAIFIIFIFLDLISALLHFY